jgi:hypothetical protein
MSTSSASSSSGSSQLDLNGRISCRMYKYISDYGYSIQVKSSDVQMIQIFNRCLAGFSYSELIIKDDPVNGTLLRANFIFIKYNREYRIIVKKEFLPLGEVIDFGDNEVGVFVKYAILVTVTEEELLRFFLTMNINKVEFLLCVENMKTGKTEKTFCRSMLLDPLQMNR